MRVACFVSAFVGVVAAAACNGNDALCGKKYSDVTFVGSHNSAFVGITPAHNQYVSVTDQLNLGVRFLQAQTQNKDGQIQMCHTDCALLDSGPLSKYLDEINTWMEAHPREVVTLLLTNIDAMPVTQFGDTFKSTGLDKYVFKPGEKVAIDQWPTLQTLIDDGTRLVVFMGMSLIVFYNSLAVTEYDRLSRRHEQSRLHSRRISVLLGDSLWRDQRRFSQLQYRPATGCRS